MLPQDPYMLLSYLNTKLRDEYTSFGELCEALDADEEETAARLAAIGYVYDGALNRFVCR